MLHKNRTHFRPVARALVLEARLMFDGAGAVAAVDGFDAGCPPVIEGQVKVVAPTFSLGDAFNTLVNAAIEITAVNSGSQGTLFFNANNDDVVDSGEDIVGARAFTLTEAADLLTKLKYAQNGTELNQPAAPSRSPMRASVWARGPRCPPSMSSPTTTPRR